MKVGNAKCDQSYWTEQHSYLLTSCPVSSNMPNYPPSSLQVYIKHTSPYSKVSVFPTNVGDKLHQAYLGCPKGVSELKMMCLHQSQHSTHGNPTAGRLDSCYADHDKDTAMVFAAELSLEFVLVAGLDSR